MQYQIIDDEGYALGVMGSLTEVVDSLHEYVEDDGGSLDAYFVRLLEPGNPRSVVPIERGDEVVARVKAAKTWPSASMLTGARFASAGAAAYRQSEKRAVGRATAVAFGPSRT